MEYVEKFWFIHGEHFSYGGRSAKDIFKLGSCKQGKKRKEIALALLERVLGQNTYDYRPKKITTGHIPLGMELENLYRNQFFPEYKNGYLCDTKSHILCISELDAYKDGKVIEIKTGAKKRNNRWKYALQWAYFCGAKEVYLFYKPDRSSDSEMQLTFIPIDMTKQKCFRKGCRFLYEYYKQFKNS